MPLYEYRCLECGDETEVLQKVSEGRKRKCEKCSGKLEKLVSRASFQLKGGGWFAQGYGSGGKSGGGSSSSGSSSSGGSDGKSGGKSDGKSGGKSSGKSGGGSSDSGGGSSSKSAPAN